MIVNKFISRSLTYFIGLTLLFLIFGVSIFFTLKEDDEYSITETNEVINNDISSEIPNYFLDNGIFSEYYGLAYKKLMELDIDEKIGQLLLVRYPGNNQNLSKYKLGGYIFYEKDFKDKTKNDIQNMINMLQDTSDIPLLTAVDEEGGKVVRISSNSNLRDSRFLSPSELYGIGGFDEIIKDTKEKSRLLRSLGINVNLAPVVDVSTNTGDYIYERTLKEDTNLVSEYASTVIKASKGSNVSYVLKHFPGYGNNLDTHIGSSYDNRSLDDIRKNDLPPFEAGIASGAEAILVSHNIVTSIDSINPASLSLNVHKLLRNDLNFTGIVISDDLAMPAVSGIDDVIVKAIKAGNDIVIVDDYEDGFNSLKSAIERNDIKEEDIDRHVLRILAWKYYKGIMFNLK